MTQQNKRIQFTKAELLREWRLQGDVCEQFQAAVNEALGVSDEVRCIVSQITFALDKNLPQFEKVEDETIRRRVKHGNFTVQHNDKKIHVACRVFIFRDQQDYDAFERQYPSMFDCASYFMKRDFETRSPMYMIGMTLNLPMINGQIPSQIAQDKISHEVEHIFQQIKADRTFPNTCQYAAAATGLQSQNEAERQVALILYLNAPEEIEAFANGLYGYLMSWNVRFVDFNTAAYQSEAYQKLLQLQEAKEYIEKNLSTPDVVNACERYKVTPQKLLAIADDVRKRMLYKFGRVFVKAHSDKRLQENIRGIARCAFHPLIGPRQILESMARRKVLLG